MNVSSREWVGDDLDLGLRPWSRSQARKRKIHLRSKHLVELLGGEGERVGTFVRSAKEFVGVSFSIFHWLGGGCWKGLRWSRLEIAEQAGDIDRMAML
jgi:hypothetical protein